MMPKEHAYICYRVLAAVHRQARRAFDEGREKDCYSLFYLMGQLTVSMFGTCSTSYILESMDQERAA